MVDTCVKTMADYFGVSTLFIYIWMLSFATFGVSYFFFKMMFNMFYEICGGKIRDQEFEEIKRMKAEQAILFLNSNIGLKSTPAQDIMDYERDNYI